MHFFQYTKSYCHFFVKMSTTSKVALFSTAVPVQFRFSSCSDRCSTDTKTSGNIAITDITAKKKKSFPKRLSYTKTLFFVENKVKFLLPVELKSCITGNQGDLLRNGLCNDYMVGRIFMPLHRVNFHLCISEKMFRFQRNN